MAGRFRFRKPFARRPVGQRSALDRGLRIYHAAPGPQHRVAAPSTKQDSSGVTLYHFGDQGLTGRTRLRLH